MYAAFVAVLGFGGGTVLQRFIRPPRGVFSLGYSFTYEVFSFLVVFGAAMIMSRIEVRSPGVYGLPIRGAFGKLFWQGCLIGLVEVSGLIGLIAAFGGYSFGGLALHGQDLLRWGILCAVFFVFVGLFEEFLFRGYTQYTNSSNKPTKTKKTAHSIPQRSKSWPCRANPPKEYPPNAAIKPINPDTSTKPMRQPCQNNFPNAPLIGKP